VLFAVAELLVSVAVSSQLDLSDVLMFLLSKCIHFYSQRDYLSIWTSGLGGTDVVTKE